MASSPPAPLSTGLPNSRKRPSLSAHPSTVANSNKRPKLHPLRQSSFPVGAEPGAHYGGLGGANGSAGGHSAKSETGSHANSALSAGGSAGGIKPAPRGRGRPRKSQQIPEDDVQTVRDSHRGGKAKSVVSSRSANANEVNQADANAAGADDEDDNEEISDLLAHSAATAAEQEEEIRQQQRQDRLKEALDPDQYARFEKWRAVKLSTNVVRRIVNQTVSQSVGQVPLQAINLYTKWFAGEIIERARDVRNEWAAAYEKTREAEKQDRIAKLQAKEKQLEEKEHERQRLREGSSANNHSGAQADSAGNSNGATPTPTPTHTPTPHTQALMQLEYDRRKILADVTRLRKEAEEYIPNPHRGGLLPDHLREALRRYKNDGEGGGVGFEGLSHPLLGTQGSSVWRVGDGATGRRLFK